MPIIGACKDCLPDLWHRIAGARTGKRQAALTSKISIWLLLQLQKSLLIQNICMYKYAVSLSLW